MKVLQTSQWPERTDTTNMSPCIKDPYTALSKRITVDGRKGGKEGRTREGRRGTAGARRLLKAQEFT